MKRLLGWTAMLCAGFVLAVFVVGIPTVVTEDGETGAVQNGDVNGDGVLDVSDAVFTLLYLFQQGPPPVACADSPELLARVAELESRMSSLEESPDSPELVGRVEALESGAAGLTGIPGRVSDLEGDVDDLWWAADTTPGRYVFFASNLCARTGEPECEPGCRHYFDFEANQSAACTPTYIVEGGQVTGPDILFSTPTAGILVVTLDVGGGETRRHSMETVIDGDDSVLVCQHACNPPDNYDADGLGRLVRAGGPIEAGDHTLRIFVNDSEDATIPEAIHQGILRIQLFPVAE